MNLKPLLILIAAVIIATLTPTHSAQAAEVDATRVMLVGDSITQGHRGEYTWRYFLWQQLQGVDFVGSRTGTFSDFNWNYNGADAYADGAFDQDHVATYGGQLAMDGVRGCNAEGFCLEQIDPIGERVAQYQPDIVVSMYGINDLTARTAPEVLADYRAWIERVRSGRADIDIVVTKLAWEWAAPAGRVAEFNAGLDVIANELSTDASRIVVASMTEGYTQSDTRDNVHPTTGGYRKIARMMGRTLASMGVTYVEQAVPAPTPVVAPLPTTPEPVVVVTSAPESPVYATCAAVRKVYKNGVAKTRKAVKKAVRKGDRRPTVARKVYVAAKRLDRDRDRVACERR
jgi:hypothetical protein